MTTPDIYVSKTPMWPHQREAFLRFANAPSSALLFEQRCGKTKVVIDKAAYLYENKLIDAMIVVAMPSSVPGNWARDEIPTHLPERIPHLIHQWDSKRAKNKSAELSRSLLLETKALAILLVNGEAILTEAFKDFIKQFFARKKIYLVADETTLIMKTPGIARTKAMHAMARSPNVVHKTIMDGTPAGEGPLDLYAQFAFLSSNIIGYTSYFAFRNRYGIWEKARVATHEYPVLKGYQNLDELYNKISKVSARVTRKQVFPNLKDKVYVKARFELTQEQRRVYNELKESYEAELQDGGHVTAAHVLTRYLRLQQVASNYWPSERSAALCKRCEGVGCEACEGAGVVEIYSEQKPIDTRDPRLECLEDQLSREREPFIVWCRFTSDVDKVMGLCQRLNLNPVRFDGSVSTQDKTIAKELFQEGNAGCLVGTAKAGGRGLRLDRASSIYYYSNEFGLLSRLQSEDRAEMMGRERATIIVDLIAEDTVDERIVNALRAKRKLSDVVLKENSGTWL